MGRGNRATDHLAHNDPISVPTGFLSRITPTSRALLIQLEHGHEGLLGHVNLAHGLHAFFALGLLLQ